MKYKTTALILCGAMFFVGCNEDKKDEPVKAQQKAAMHVRIDTPAAIVEKVIVKQDYTIDEIYNSMCIQCHSADGSGNTEKLTPSMRDLSQQEMFDELKNVEDENGHVVMEHNRDKIVEMGMEYSAKDMAEYMFKRFNPEVIQEEAH